MEETKTIQNLINLCAETGKSFLSLIVNTSNAADTIDHAFKCGYRIPDHTYIDEILLDTEGEPVFKVTFRKFNNHTKVAFEEIMIDIDECGNGCDKLDACLYLGFNFYISLKFNTHRIYILEKTSCWSEPESQN